MKKKPKLVLHNLIEREGDRYGAICLELDVASQGKTVAEAEANLKEAVELYLEDVLEAGDEKDFIPRPAPVELWLRFFEIEEAKLREQIKGDLNHSLQFEIAVHA